MRSANIFGNSDKYIFRSANIFCNIHLCWKSRKISRSWTPRCGVLSLGLFSDLTIHNGKVDWKGDQARDAKLGALCLEFYIPTFPTYISVLNLSLRNSLPPPRSLCLTLPECNEHKRACVGSHIAQGRRWTLPVCLVV